MIRDDLAGVIMTHRPSQWWSEETGPRFGPPYSICTVDADDWPCLSYRLATRAVLAETTLASRAPAYMSDYAALVDQLHDAVYEDGAG